MRLTPDGFASVASAARCTPFSPDNLVDIAGSSWEIEDCNRFLFAGAAIPYAPRPGQMTPEPGFDGFSGEWDVETNRFGHYVVFNASERIAGQLVDALEAAGLSVQRWDVSHRTASDGRFYDWFARLRFKGSRDECVADAQRSSQLLARSRQSSRHHSRPSNDWSSWRRRLSGCSTKLCSFVNGWLPRGGVSTASSEAS